ncbi:Uncharacterised protein [Klebsiella pneumoniae]|nr:Uncharacterised protein [Klebsiella pneumoniae]
MQLFDKLAGMIGQRIADLHQPAAAVRRAITFLQVAQHIVQRQHFALTSGDDQPLIHIQAHRHQLVGPLISTAVDTAQGDQRPVTDPRHPRPGALPRQGIAYVIGQQRGGRQPVGAVAMGIVEMQPARLVFVDNIVIGERLNAPLPVEHPREDRVRYLQLRAFNRVHSTSVNPYLLNYAPSL